MSQYFYSTLPTSPVQQAFEHIEWNAPIAVSKPEQNLLVAAEENPLEYTIADYGDAFAYARLLLKVLDQVTMILSDDTSSTNNFTVRQLSLFDQQARVLDEEAALQYYDDDKLGVVTHYLICRLCDFIGILVVDKKTTTRKISSPVRMLTIFYNNYQLLDDWKPLLRLLLRGNRDTDTFVQRGAAICLMYILRAGFQGVDSIHNNPQGKGGQFLGQPVVQLELTDKATQQDNLRRMEDALQSLISWLTSNLQSSNGTSLGVITPTLMVLSSCRMARIAFCRAGGIGYLSRHLSRQKFFNTSSSSTKTISSVSVQHLYELCFCLWTMTFDCLRNDDETTFMRQNFLRDGTIGILAKLVSSAPREKVTRLALASLCNLAQLPDNENIVQAMISCNLLKSVQLLHERQWTDADIADDLQLLETILLQNYKELTKWETYQVEMQSGRLEWGILHTETFFRENVRRMEGPNSDFAPVKRLLRLIAQNSKKLRMAGSTFDLGFVYGATPKQENEPIDLLDDGPLDGGQHQDFFSGPTFDMINNNTNNYHDNLHHGNDDDEDGDDEEQQHKTLAICCFDLGEFVRHYPNGRSIAKRLGAKNMVMALLEHENGTVQVQALQCLSKLLMQRHTLTVSERNV